MSRLPIHHYKFTMYYLLGIKKTFINMRSFGLTLIEVEIQMSLVLAG